MPWINYFGINPLLPSVAFLYSLKTSDVLWFSDVFRIYKKETLEFNALREKCPNTKFFLVRIFLHSDWIRIDTPYLFVFSPNVGKYGPEKSSYLDTFHAVIGERKGFPFTLKFWIDFYQIAFNQIVNFLYNSYIFYITISKRQKL